MYFKVYIFTCILQQQDIHSLIGSNDAKDKTQVASATSMAVIHVGILKAILDLGPSGIAHYNWCLGFVITALALQFISGIIAIYIATMKSFLSQFKYDIGYYLKRSLCPCIFKTKSQLHTIGEEISLVDNSESSNATGCCAYCKEFDGRYFCILA